MSARATLHCLDCGGDGRHSGETWSGGYEGSWEEGSDACPSCLGQGEWSRADLIDAPLPALIDLRAAGLVEDADFASIVLHQAGALEEPPSETYWEQWKLVPEALRLELEDRIETIYNAKQSKKAPVAMAAE